MLRTMLPFATARLLRRPIAAADIVILVRILYVFVVVIDVNVAVCPSAVITPATAPCGSEHNTSPKS